MTRAAWHAALAWRASRLGAGAAVAVGLLLGLLLPVEDAWLAGLAAGACALVALLLVALEGRGAPTPPPASVDTSAALESMGTAGQLAQAFGRSAIALAGFAAGLGLAALLDLGRA